MPVNTSFSTDSFARELKDEARRLGFDACGISKADQLTEEARRLESWLNQGHHGTMAWMERNFEKRIDPRKLVPGAKSVVSVVQNYWQPQNHPDRGEVGKISRYAWGDDYHDVMKEKLFELFHWLETNVGALSGRAFVDSAPVMDKAWAARSGLGWIGKHTNLINQHMGSFFFLGELIVDVSLAPDSPVADHCGTCTQCIDACPTDAIHSPYQVDSNRCISYLTIEHREDDIPDSIKPDMLNWIYGCDICQDVCPWNKFKKPSSESRYQAREGVVDSDLREWIEMDIETWRKRFKGNPVKRAKFDGFKRNVRIALENQRQERNGR